VCPLAWYSHAYYIAMTSPPHQFMGSDGLQLEKLHFYMFVGRRLVGSSLTPIVALGMLAGLFLPPSTKYGRMFYWWLVAISLFIIAAGVGNRHPWYQLPVIPVAAAFAGQACDFVLRRIRKLTQSSATELLSAGALVLVLFVVSYTYVRPLYDPWADPLREAGYQLDRIASPDALAVFVVEGDSSGIYYGKRKGWHAFDDSAWGPPLDSAQAIMELEKLRKRGATHLVFTQYTAWWLDYYEEFGSHLDLRYQRLTKTSAFVIFDLSDKLNDRTESEVF
jgi:hypothetical protein